MQSPPLDAAAGADRGRDGSLLQANVSVTPDVTLGLTGINRPGQDQSAAAPPPDGSLRFLGLLANPHCRARGIPQEGKSSGSPPSRVGSHSGGDDPGRSSGPLEPGSPSSDASGASSRGSRAGSRQAAGHEQPGPAAAAEGVPDRDGGGHHAEGSDPSSHRPRRDLALTGVLFNIGLLHWLEKSERK